MLVAVQNPELCVLIYHKHETAVWSQRTHNADEEGGGAATGVIERIPKAMGIMSWVFHHSNYNRVCKWGAVARMRMVENKEELRKSG